MKKEASDTIKDILLQLRKTQSQDMSDTDLITRYESFTGSMVLNQSGLSIWQQPINDSFVLGHPINGVLGEVNPNSKGTISGCSWASGNMGFGYDKALNFNGSPSSVTIPDNNLFTGSQITVSFWMKMGSNYGVNAENWYILSKPSEYLFYLYRVDGKMYWNINSSYEVNSTTTSWSSGQWYHIVGALTPENRMALYVNGSLQADVAKSTTIPNTGSNLYFGKNNETLFSFPSNNQSFKGVLDEIKIYNRGLNSSEIGSLFSKVNYPTDRLIAYYKFDEGTGSYAYNSASVEMPTADAIAHFRFNTSGTVVNSEINSYSGLCHSGITWNAGVYGNGSSVGFNGSPSYIQINSNFGLNGGSAMTASFWLNPSATQNQYTGYLGAADTQWDFRHDQSGASLIYFFVSGISNGVARTLSSNVWQHIVGVKTPTTISLYHNGSLVSTASHTGNIISPSTNYIGWYGGGNRYFSGLIDEVKILNRAWSAQEVLNEYQGKTIQPLLGDRRTGSILLYSGNY